MFITIALAKTIPMNIRVQDPYSKPMMGKTPMMMGKTPMMMGKTPMGSTGGNVKPGKNNMPAPANGDGSLCVSVSVANVRGSPCGSVVGTVQQGQQVTLVGSPAAAGSCSLGSYQWQQISAPVSGYVATSLLTTCPNNNGGSGSSSSGNCPSFPLYKQCDSQWSSQRLGTSSNTICSAGCAMSSVAMAGAGIGITINGNTINPSNFDTWLTSNGGFASGDLLVWNAVSSLGALNVVNSYKSLTQTQINTFLSNCQPIVANVRSGSHWVLLTSSAGGGNYNVNDPGFSTTSYAMSGMSMFVVYNSVATVSADLTDAVATAHQAHVSILPVKQRTTG